MSIMEVSKVKAAFDRLKVMSDIVGVFTRLGFVGAGWIWFAKLGARLMADASQLYQQTGVDPDSVSVMRNIVAIGHISFGLIFAMLFIPFVRFVWILCDTAISGLTSKPGVSEPEPDAWLLTGMAFLALLGVVGVFGAILFLQMDEAISSQLNGSIPK
ncbi:hypothetical protein MOV61_08095 [Neorhizobium sp. BETTINA12A]|uniref:hypothetical protein n=1 Tax=Neorhizobium sp. BETTINA12A TaxID=2908924 RepID=UPI001FF56B3F|nr:hypothetical protein [Neorhizobium sp. BETTINA12A]MCJ9750676.1 hypothetical protein [Neorhizobium sp. BETTINA12A]